MSNFIGLCALNGKVTVMYCCFEILLRLVKAAIMLIVRTEYCVTLWTVMYCFYLLPVVNIVQLTSISALDSLWVQPAKRCCTAACGWCWYCVCHCLHTVRGAMGSRGSVDPSLFRVCGAHAAFDPPPLFVSFPTLTPTFRYPPRPLCVQ